MTTGTLVDDGESILQEAQRLTHGARNKDYGHPLDDYTRTAAMVSAMLAHKLKEPLTAAEMALAMVCVKMSRQVNAPKRDNMVDAAGYAWVSHACLEELERRRKPVPKPPEPFRGVPSVPPPMAPPMPAPLPMPAMPATPNVPAGTREKREHTGWVNNDGTRCTGLDCWCGTAPR